MDVRNPVNIRETPDHHGSHRHLLWMPESSSPGKIDAIIVPTIRHPLRLDTARQLSAELGCTLVTLHSGKWTSASVASVQTDVRPPLHVAIDVPDMTALRLPDFETTRLTSDTLFGRRKDTSAKRNLALMLAYLLSWQRIIFLDDDIAVPDSGDLRNAVGLLDTYNAVGLSIGGYPDNSVVCHAYRLIGGNQDSFIGGGALTVETTRNRSFFPDIYNEDWFYLLDPEKGLQPLAVTGKVIQSPYEPFREERARAEELGDVLAEGIFWLLDQGRALADADSGHWRGYLGRRRRFIEYILRNVGKASVDAAEKARIVASLRASLGRLARIQPEWCERYLAAWMADRVAWERHMSYLPRRQGPEDAIRWLVKRGRAHPPFVIRNLCDSRSLNSRCSRHARWSVVHARMYRRKSGLV
jgi:hypothetical protein